MISAYSVEGSLGIETGAVITLKNFLRESIRVTNLIDLDLVTEQLNMASQLIANSLLKRANVLTCGNGGSFSDASHFAGELVNNFTAEHNAYSVLVLGSNQAVATAWSNDYGYETQFAREFEAFASADSTLIVFSTSGKSRNVNITLDRARQMGVQSIVFTSMVGEVHLKEKCDVIFVAPTESTPKAQEVHIILYHALAKAVEDLLNRKKD